MMEWMNMLMQPQNQEALLNTLAQKGMPPPEALQALQGRQVPQMSQIPGAPDSFSGMLQQAGAPGMQPMQPSPDGQSLMPVPPPQLSQVPGMAQPGPGMQHASAQPLQFGPQPEAQPNPGLRPEQMMQLMAQGQGQGQDMPRPPSPPGLMSGGSVRDPQMLQAQPQKGGRPTLAQLLYGR